jgi:hypothetical protein
MRADRSGTIAGQPLYEAWVVTLDRGLVLQFEVCGVTQAELDQIVKSLDSVRFDSEAAPTQKP